VGGDAVGTHSPREPLLQTSTTLSLALISDGDDEDVGVPEEGRRLHYARGPVIGGDLGVLGRSTSAKV
jgi:hypothetical protein